MRFHLTMSSRNTKTGPIPVATSSNDTCPVHCALRERVCYARYSKLGFWWEAVSLGLHGYDLRAFLGKISKIPEGALWRYGQAGDVPGNGLRIDRQALDRIVTFQKGRRGFAYTHYLSRPPGWCWERWASSKTARHNMEAIREANRNGFTINLSADDLDDADRVADLEVGPVVVLLPARVDRDTGTSQGREVRLCAHNATGVTCQECRLCADPGRTFLIGLPAHGVGRIHVPTRRALRTA